VPRSETILTVFISAPSDLNDERKKCFEVVEKINREWARDKGVRLEPVTWETDTYSSMGSDPQAIVNQQLRDYDIFIGLMWHRFGTPTPRAGSGTVEEFLEAKKRFLDDASDVAVSFYFKDAPVAPSALDALQLVKVLEFKESMSAHGELYREFIDTSSLEDLVRLQLSKQIQQRAPTVPSQSREVLPMPVSATGIVDADVDDDEEDAGLLDSIITSNERFAEVNGIVERLSLGMSLLGTQTNSATVEIEAIISSPVPLTDPKPVMAIFARISADMDQFAGQIDAELPQYRRAFRDGLDAAVESLELNLRTLAPDVALAKGQETRSAIVEMLNALSGARDSLVSFRASLAELPPLSKKLNKARRRLLAALDNMLKEWEENLSYIGNLLK
jgi:hypothetical protein